jgi:hypothetical protein
LMIGLIVYTSLSFDNSWSLKMKSNLTLSPTSLQSGIILKVDDYQWNVQTKCRAIFESALIMIFGH